MLDQPSFGYWLRLRRKSLDLTREGFAERVGCSVSTIRKLEEEERRPSAQIAEQLADIFNIPPTERKNFLQFARGDWQLAPKPVNTEVPLPLLPTIQPPRSNLPLVQTSLIGREGDIAAVYHYLTNPSIRLVTLIGPPGIGKTRLSIECARKTLGHFPNGIFFIELAPVGHPSLIPSAIMQAFGFVQTKDLPTAQQLAHGVGNKQLLLVLDNCEHLIEEAASLANNLLSACPGLKVLATSRERLRIPGEWVYSVPTLSMPVRNTEINTGNLSNFPSLLLFVERARAVRSDFVLDDSNIHNIRSICSHLDGLPLGIELIAAQTHWMSLQTIMERLDDQFILSSAGMRAVPLRQQSLNNVIHWSYHLLSEQEKKIFALLSIFTGGFRLDTAEEIFSKTFPEIPVSVLIRSLTDKSLLQPVADEQGWSRFMMLETVKAFALQQLLEIGMEDDARQEYLIYFVKLVERADLEVLGPSAVRWVERIESEYANIHAALEWSVSKQDAGSALRLLGGLGWLWQISGRFSEARFWLNEIRKLPGLSSYPTEYAQILNHIGRQSWTQERMEEARILLEESELVCKSAGAEGELPLADCFNWLGLVALTYEQDIEKARDLIQRSLSLFKKWGSRNGEALAMFNLGIVETRLDRGDVALSLLENSLSIFRQDGDLLFIARVSRYLGNLLLKQGQFEKARRFFEEHLRIDMALKFWDGIGHAYGELGILSRYQGEFDQSEEFFMKCLMVHYEHGLEPDGLYAYSLVLIALHRNNYPLACQRALDCYHLSGNDQKEVRDCHLFHSMAAMAAGIGQPESSARLWGMARTALEFANMRYEPVDQMEFDRHMLISRDQLGDIQFEALALEGCVMEKEQSVEYALELAKSLSITSK